ncbi:MAG TPA: hypothetical protein VD860_15985 [Azospirillum sp.]|nr:hypothetical protein [Azospirillum sp.]
MNAVSPPLSDADRPVRVHGLEDACGALEAAAARGLPAVLVGPPGGGALWLLRMAEAARAAVPGAGCVVVHDCGDRAGEALGALAAGATHVLFTGPPVVAERLAAIAADRGAVVLRELPSPCGPVRPAPRSARVQP